MPLSRKQGDMMVGRGRQYDIIAASIRRRFQQNLRIRQEATKLTLAIKSDVDRNSFLENHKFCVTLWEQEVPGSNPGIPTIYPPLATIPLLINPCIVCHPNWTNCQNAQKEDIAGAVVKNATAPAPKISAPANKHPGRQLRERRRENISSESCQFIPPLEYSAVQMLCISIKVIWPDHRRSHTLPVVLPRPALSTRWYTALAISH